MGAYSKDLHRTVRSGRLVATVIVCESWLHI